MSSYFDTMDRRISAVRESPVAGHLQAPWKTLSHVTQGLEDVEITAAASLDGIATIAMWRRERGADGDFKPWVATALDGQLCEVRNVYAIEGELVPTEPPYAHIDCARALAEIEGELVRDVTVRVMFPDFPEDLREAIHRTVLRYGVTMIPDLAYPADFETFQEHQARLHTLSGDLHTIFHDAAHRGFSDQPQMGVWKLYAEGEAQREQMVLAMPTWKCASAECNRLWALDAEHSGALLARSGTVACPRCGSAGAPVCGTDGEPVIYGAYRIASGFDTPCYECGAGCEGGRWASDTPGLCCATCGAVGLPSGFTYGDAVASGLVFPRRELTGTVES